MGHNCKRCVYYRADLNLCDGFTYRCECLDSFCPMYETNEMIEFSKTVKNSCEILKQDEAYSHDEEFESDRR